MTTTRQIKVAQSLGNLKRPFYAIVNGKTLTNVNGVRRFATVAAAEKAAKDAVLDTIG
jgi:hypothetical protein